MDKAILKKTDELLRNELMKMKDFWNNDRRSAEYRIEHSYRVAYIGEKIAKAEGLNVDKTFIACLLHDIGYSVEYFDAEGHRNHGRAGAKIVRPFLTELGFSQHDVNEICYGIAIHVDGKADFEGEITPMVLTVGTADNIDRWDAFRLYEGLHVAKYRDLPLQAQKEHIAKTIKSLSELRNIECGTKTGEELWHEKIDYQLDFYKRLEEQVNHSFCIELI